MFCAVFRNISVFTSDTQSQTTETTETTTTQPNDISLDIGVVRLDVWWDNTNTIINFDNNETKEHEHQQFTRVDVCNGDLIARFVCVLMLLVIINL